MGVVYHPKRYLEVVSEETIAELAEDARESIRRVKRKAPGFRDDIFTPMTRVGIDVFDRSSIFTNEADRKDLMDEVENIEQTVRSLVRAGTNIFDLSSVIRQLALTDVADDVMCDDLKFPFPSFYVHFGDSGLKGPYPNRHVEGVYVNFWEKDGLNGKDALFVRLVFNEPEVSDNPFDRLAEASRGVEFVIEKTETLNDGIEQACENEKTRGREWSGTIRDAFRLAVASVCYISALDDDIEEGWSPGAPADLVEQTKSLRGRISRHAAAKLGDLGFTRVRLPKSDAGGVDYRDSPSGSSVGDWIARRSHWRRGHFRRQAHGPGYSMRKIIWIKPVQVAPDAPQAVEGHVYEPPKMNPQVP